MQQGENSAGVQRFVVTRSRRWLACLMLIVTGAFLYALDPKDEGILYFFVIPCGGIAVLAALIMLVKKPPTVVIDGESVMLGRRRFPLAEVGISDIEIRMEGNVRARVFDLIAADESGALVTKSFDGRSWSDFERMHHALQQAVAPYKHNG